jgi:hypothetical protein
MPTRYGRPVATMRTSPQRQPPVNCSKVLLLQRAINGTDLYREYHAVIRADPSTRE